jgi:CRISPR-associated protein Csd2
MLNLAIREGNKMTTPISNRYEFVLFYDVENGNPNGDPDSGNMPRLDPETSHGIVTDVCIKRKIRNYVEAIKEDVDGYDIYVRENVVLNTQHQRAYDALEIKSESKKMPKDKEVARQLTTFMCKNFYDIRTFGAVMSTEVNAGVVRGPVQLNFSRSVDPVMQQEITITRVAITNEKNAEDKEHEMGRKQIIPYGLYRLEGYVSAKLAEKTGFSADDLSLLWEALVNMFEFDHSAARGKMASRALYVFKHDSAFGNAPSSALFDLIVAEKKTPEVPARNYRDYAVSVGETPSGVTLEQLL